MATYRVERVARCRWIFYYTRTDVGGDSRGGFAVMDDFGYLHELRNGQQAVSLAD